MVKKIKKIKIFFFLLFVLLVLFSIWFWRRNIFSKEVLKLEILGPTEAVFGQEVEYLVKYKNNSNFRLEDPELIFEPPKNSQKEGKIFERQILKKEELGEVIYPGEEKITSFKMQLFGKEGEMKTVKVFLSYRPKNLKAKYESSTTFGTIIKSIPITFEFDLPSKIEANKNFTFRINYFSNLDTVLKDLIIQVNYPLGFEFIKSTPPFITEKEWSIPLLNKSQGGRIEIEGKIFGEVREVKIFRAKIGIWQGDEFIILKETEKGLEITKPSIFIRQEINGNPQYIAFPGDWLHYEIYFKNIGNEDLVNLFMICKLEGDAFDFETVNSDTGFTKPGDNTIVFDGKNIPKLKLLTPMEEEKVDFWIKLKEDFGDIKNPFLKNTVFISQSKEEFITKITSKLEIVQKGYFEDEVFGNSGPLPPKVGQTTTYTIFWQVKNYYSDIKNVKIKATLPEQSYLTGKIFPLEMASKFSYDPQSREIVWSIGDLEKGIGVSKPSITLAFQISFLPVELQKGKAPEIISEVKILGEDIWTEKEIISSSSAITTATIEDAINKTEKGIVQ